MEICRIHKLTATKLICDIIHALMNMYNSHAKLAQSWAKLEGCIHVYAAKIKGVVFCNRLDVRIKISWIEGLTVL